MKFWSTSSDAKNAHAQPSADEASAPATVDSQKPKVDWAATKVDLPAQFEQVAEMTDAPISSSEQSSTANTSDATTSTPDFASGASQEKAADSTPAPIEAKVDSAPPVQSEERKQDAYAERLKYLKETLSLFHNGAATLSPQELTVPDHLPKKVLIVGHCSAENWAFHQNNVTKTPCEFLLVNNLQVLPARSNEELSEFDFQVINFPLRFILQDSFLWGANAKSEAQLEAIFAQSVESLRRLFDLYTQYNAQNGLLTFVTNFMVPSFNPNGKLAPYYSLRNPQHYVERLNQEIERLAQERSNTFVIHLDSITSYFGKRYIQEDLLHLISHGSYMPGNRKDESRIEHAPPLGDHYRLAYTEFLAVLWVEIISAYRIANPRQQIKLIVIDLDDTLWNGAVGDMSSLEIGVTEGWPVGVLEALSYFKDRGGLVAILSKNYPETVQKAWQQFYESRFSMKHFISVKTSFSPKYLQMKEILAETNLTPESVLFIDDNPVERAEMKAAYPKMRVLHGFHYYWRKIIMLAAETQVASFTKESLDRTELIKKQLELKKQLEESESRESFLSALEIQVDITVLSSEDDQAFERCFELINKTNQFNTTGVRWARGDFLECVKRSQVLYFTVQDRYSSHGIVGVLVLDAASITQFVMSCRVVGLNVEFGVLDQVLKFIAHQYPKQAISAQLVPTDLNLLSRNLYSDFGFREQGGRLIYDESLQVKPHYQGSYMLSTASFNSSVASSPAATT